MRFMGSNPSSPAIIYQHLSRVDRCFSFCPESQYLCGIRSFLVISDVVRCLIQSVLLYIEILGHTDVQMTMGLYRHAEDEQKRKQILAVNM